MSDNEAFAALATALGNVEIVDLTVPLAEGLPANWPTHMPFQRKVYNWYAPQDHPQQPFHGFRGPYYTAFLILDEHCGTHIDSPAHFIPPSESRLPHAGEMGGMTLDKVPLSRMMGPARVVDATDLKDTGDPGKSPLITPEHVLRHEQQHGKLEPGDIALFRSDWDEHYVPMPDGGGSYAADPFLAAKGPGWPAPGIPCLELLLERGVTTLGLDGVSVGGVDDPAPAHHFGLGKGMLYIELLANLKQLPPRGAYFVYLPLNIQGGSAGPGRGIGLVPKG